MSAPEEPPKTQPAPSLVLTGALRVATFLLIAFLVGTVLTRVAAQANRRTEPASFARGMLHGALMPMAMPSLLFGRDVPIYAEKNTGRMYRLGYTVGVNVCGAIFFGLLFWRLQRIRNLSRAGCTAASKDAISAPPG